MGLDMAYLNCKKGDPCYPTLIFYFKMGYLPWGPNDLIKHRKSYTHNNNI